VALRILALRAAGLGDLLTAVPALRALAGVDGQQAGSPEVAVATSGWLVDLVGLIPGIAGFVGVDGLRPVGVTSADWVVNLHGCGPQSHRALNGIGRRRFIAYRCPGAWEEGPHWVEEEDERARWCRLLQSADISADPADVGLERPSVQAPVEGAVVLHLGATVADRRWPASAFARVASALGGLPVVLTGTAHDRAAAQQIVERAGLAPSSDLTGRLGLLQLAALVSSARLVVSGDTGVAHLATAYARPSVTIFAAASVTRWGPPLSPLHRVVRSQAAPRPAAMDVPPSMVLSQVGELLALESVA